jgi:hypothetical protein
VPYPTERSSRSWAQTYQVPSPAAHVVDGLKDVEVSFSADADIGFGENVGDERQEGDEDVQTHFRNEMIVMLDVDSTKVKSGR